MANRTHVPVKGVFTKDEPPVWHADCDAHQWAVADGSLQAVDALVREHTREHPTVHCAPPPVYKAEWPRGELIRYKVQRFEWADGSVTHCGQCGRCPSPGWNILHVDHPVDAYMEEHWVVAHAD